MVPAIDENGIIETYEVMYQPLVNYDSTSIIMNTSDLFISVINLHAFADYSVQVRAYTDVGAGPYSDEQIMRTNEAGQQVVIIMINDRIQLIHSHTLSS